MPKPRKLIGKHKNRLILLSLSCMIMVCIVSGVLFGSQYLSDIGQANRNATALSVRSVLNSIDHSLREAENLALLVGLDESVRDALEDLRDEPDGSFAYMKRSHELKFILANFINAHSYISNIIPIAMNGNLLNEALIYEKQRMGEMIHLDTMRARDDFVAFWGNVYPLYSTPSDRVYTCVRKIFSMKGAREVIGYIQVDIQPETIDRTLNNAMLGDTSTVALFDSENTLISVFGDASLIDAQGYADQDEEIIDKDDGKYLLVRETSNYSGWSIAILMHYDELFHFSFAVTMSFIMVLIACLLFSVLLIISIQKKTHIPLLTITDGIHQIEQGDFDVHVDIHTGDEFEYIAGSLNNMAKQLKGLLDRLMKEQAMKKDAEMYAMRAQINPHFMCNTLNAIRYLARKGEAEKCERVVVALAELCSASMGNDRVLQTLKKELQLCERYFQILRARYGDGITMSTQMPQALENCLIPKFTLQPLIENAVFHGISINKSGEIRIAVARAGDDMEITVEDNGVGMDEKTVGALNERLNTIYTDKLYGADSLNHIGMENVSNRIKMEFGMQYGIRVTSVSGQRTVISIRVPVKVGETEDGQPCR